MKVIKKWVIIILRLIQLIKEIAKNLRNKGKNVAKSIKIKLKRGGENCDIGASKFFGTPTVSQEIFNAGFDEDEIFFCQIRLFDIAPFDKENRLPHEGYLYIFLKTEDGKYDLKPVIRYCKEEPSVAIDRFNESVEEYSHLINDFYMEFSAVEEDEVCTKLFGLPADWNYQGEPPAMFMQFDPLDNDSGFLDEIDGFIYFFFKNGSSDFKKVYIHLEYS